MLPTPSQQGATGLVIRTRTIGKEKTERKKRKQQQKTCAVRAMVLLLRHRFLRLVNTCSDFNAGAAFDTCAASGSASAVHFDLTAAVRVELAHVDLGWWERRVA